MARRLRLLIFIVFFTICFLIYFLGKEYMSNYLFRMKLDNFIEPESGERVLIIAPHCDDEVLGPGELISRGLKKGVDFKVVLMTNGDGFTDALNIAFHEIRPRKEDYIRFGYLRQKETINAMRFLGLDESNIVFLGYPDGGLYNMWSVGYWSTPYESLHTGQSNSPYVNSYTLNTSYTGQNVVNDLSKIISQYNPDYIVYPHPNDRHHDHLASYCFTKYVLNQLQLQVKEYLYLVHRGDWPVITTRSTELYLVPPPSLAKTHGTWYAFNLLNEEVLEKGEAIEKYQSQVHAMGARLLAFARKNELFSVFNDGNILSSGKLAKSTDYKRFLLTTDPTSDVLFSTIQGGGDLRALYGYQDINRDCKFFIESRAIIRSDTRYLFDIILFNNNLEVCRINLSLRDNNRLITLKKGDEIETIKDVSSSIKGRLIEITIPSKYISSADKCFIGATSSVLGVRLDNTAWRMYNLKDEQ